MSTARDGIKWTASGLVEKFDEDQTRWLANRLHRRLQRADFERYKIRPSGIAVAERNLLTTAGVTRCASLIIAGGGQGATNTATRLGVGNGAGTAAVGDTDLSASAGASNRYFMTMDATYPSAAAGVVTFRSTFGTSDGNFAWNEWGIDIGTPTVSGGTTVAACLLNHKTSAALGTKAAGTTWTFTATVTLS